MQESLCVTKLEKELRKRVKVLESENAKMRPVVDAAVKWTEAVVPITTECSALQTAVNALKRSGY